MESVFFRDFFWEFFPREVKNIIFTWRGAREVCLKRTSENSELGKTQILFWVEGSIGGCGRVWGSHKVGYAR